MPTTRLRAVVALAFAAGVASLSACGGDSGGGPSFSDSVSTSDAQDFASDVVDNASSAAEQLNFGGGSFGVFAPSFTAPRFATPYLPRSTRSFGPFGAPAVDLGARISALRMAARNPAGLHLSPAEGCTLTESGISEGGVVDVNQNDIPDNLFIRQECNITDSTSNPDTTYTTYQLIEEHIVENMGALYGFTISAKQIEKHSDEFGNFESAGVEGNESLDIRSGHASHTYNFVQREGEKFDTAAAAIEFGSTMDADFTPSGSITLGDPLPDGALTVNGREYVTNTEDVNLSFSLSTTTPLAYSAACAAAPTDPPFTAGVVRGLLNNNSSQASFTVTFTSCGNASVTTSGTHDPAPVAMRR